MSRDNGRAWFGRLEIAFFLGGITVPCWETLALAQIIPDETLGAESSVVTPDNIKGLESDRISGGAARGSNLFHSFREFNIGEGRGGYFENPEVIENIFSRVTGSNPSEILGNLGVLGNANLFFLNPNGIIFGSNASLDLRGSFLATTADSILFPDDKQFSATNPEAPPLLTVNVQQPVGLEFEEREGIITHQGNLDVDLGQNLALVGGDVTLDGGSLIAPGGKVELGGLSAAGEIGINADSSLSFPDEIERADVTLTNDSDVDVRAGDEGSITVNARNLELSGGKFGRSLLLVGIAEESGSLAAQAGDIILNATDTISVSQGSIIANQVAPTGVGNSGRIDITTANLSLTQGGRVDASTFGEGDAGAITIEASGTISAEGQDRDRISSGIYSQVVEGIGSSGGINLTTTNLSLTQGGRIDASTGGEGDAGAITIETLDTISVAGIPSGIASQVVGVGNSGGINLTTANLSLTQGGQVDASTFGEGDAGAITIEASDTISIDGETQAGFNSGIFSRVLRVGNSGGINLTTANLSLTQGGRVNANTFGDGAAGNLTITTGQLLIQDGAQVSASTFSDGNGGRLTVNASESLQIIGESADGRFQSVLSTQTQGSGKAGDLSIITEQLLIKEGAFVSASTFGDGNGGRLTVNASESLQVIGSAPVFGTPSGLFTQTGGGTGDAGDQTITTKRLLIRDANNIAIGADTFGEGDAGNIIIETETMNVINSQVGSIVFGKGNAGNLTVHASESVEVSGKIANIILNKNIENPAGLFAQVNTTGEGRGGNLNVETERLSVSNGGKVQVATFGQGDAGNLTIRASEVEVFDTPVDSSIVTGINAGIEIDPDETVVPPRGNGGDLTIETDLLSVRNGAEVSASTAGKGNAGKLGIQASESVEVVGTSPNGDFKSKITAAVTPEGIGSGGSLSIETGQMIVRDGAEVTVSSLGSGVAGNLEVQADSISLDNQGAIAATTRLGDGGNITLKSQDLLLLRRGSQISTTAGTDETGGDGGNIIIDAPFIIAFPQENSDITANAFEGKGGNINIDTDGIFGISKRDDETSLSDITASSEFGQPGEVEINTSAIDPTRGLNNLPQEATEAEVAQSCQTVGGRSTLEFFDIGRGGLPPSPDDLLTSEMVIAEWIPLDLAEYPTSNEIFSESKFTTTARLKLSCQSKQ